KLGIGNLCNLGMAGMSTAAGYSRRLFGAEAARRVIPGLSLHVDLGPEDFGSAALGLVLALLATGHGFQVPVGGARAITDALLERLAQHGGQIEFGTRVESIVVRQQRAVAVRAQSVAYDSDRVAASAIDTHDRNRTPRELPVRKAILADVGAPALYLKLL